MVKYHNKTKTGAISEMNGAKIAVKCLAEQGVTQVFAYPGASVLPLLSAIDAEKRISVCMNTHEQFCAFAADGYARASGRVGVCIATSGPGATNLVTGIADAYMDSIPLVAITGNVPLSLLGTDAFQEIDIAGVTMPITKHNFIVKSVEALAPTLREAFRIASEGRKGPVLVDIPSDIFTSESKYIRAEAAAAAPEAEKSFPNLISVAGLINKSERPVICVGGGVIASGASARIKELADILSCPVVSTAMGIGGFDGTDTRYCGVTGMDNEPYTLKPISECDLFIAVGVRFSERMISPLRSQGDVRVVHIDIDDAEIDKNLSPCGSLIGDASEVLERLCPLLKRRSGWYGFSLHERVKSVYSLISDILPDAVYTTEVGMHQVAACRSLAVRRPRTLLTSGGLGAMGFGLPAAIGACLSQKGVTAVNIAGDGSFNMNMAELSTAVTHGLDLIEVVINNRVLGMIAEKLGAGAENASFIKTPHIDYAAAARAFGAHGESAHGIEEFEKALSGAAKRGGVNVIDYCPEETV